MSQVERTEIDSTSSILKVTVAQADFLPEYQKQIKTYRMKAQMKGFRPGTAPMSMVKKLYGKSILYEVMMETVNQKLFEQLRESGLQILAQPAIVEEQSDKIELDVEKPMDAFTLAFKVGHYSFELEGLDKGSKLTRYKLSDLQKRAEEELDRMARRSVRPEETTEKIAEGDILYVESKERNPDGSEKADGYQTTINIFTKGMNMAESLKTQLYGNLAAGDTFSFNARELDMPRAEKSEEENEKFYRRYVLNLEESDVKEIGDHFIGTIRSVLRTGDPVYDAAFYEQAFPEGIDTKEAAIEHLKLRLDTEYDEAFQFALRRQAKNALLEKNQFALPEEILKGWFMENDKQLTSENIDANLPALLNQVRLQLITDRLEDELGLEVEGHEIEEYFAAAMREQYQFYIPDQYLRPMVKKMMVNKEQVNEAKFSLRHRKVMDYVINQMLLVDLGVTEEDLPTHIDADIEKERQMFGVKYH